MADAPDIDPSLLAEFVSEGLETLDGLDPLFVELEANPDDESIVDGIFRPVHSVKGNSGFFGLHNIRDFAHVMENLLGEIRNRKRKATPPLIDLLLKGVDFLRGMVHRLAQGDLSGDFTTEEKEHLKRLEEVNAEVGNDAAPADGAAGVDDEKLGECVMAVQTIFNEYMASIDDNGLALLGDAIKNLYNHVYPPPPPPPPAGDVRYEIAGEDVTDAVAAVEEFLSEIVKNEREESRCEAFRKALSTLRAVAESQKAPDTAAAVDVLVDEFETLHNSGIGFDELMASLMQERFDAVTAGLERTGANPLLAVPEEARVGQVDVVEALEALSVFLGRLGSLGDDPACVNDFKRQTDQISRAATEAGRDDILGAVDSLRGDFLTLQESGIGFDALMSSLMAEKYAALVTAIEGGAAAFRDPAESSAGAPPSEAQPPADAGQKAASAGAPAAKPAMHVEGGKTIRVAEEKVDSFMNFVGELIITGEVFSYIQKKLDRFPEARSVSQEFKNANLSFSELSGNLQKSLMEVRRVPLKSVMQKLPRIIRDTATQLGKHIDFELVGEDTQIDKSLLEGLESPLVHMVRNSVDHGVEMPDARQAAGKPEKGRVVITATANEEQFSLSIVDDGKGLDVEALKGKAVSKGLITEEQARTMPDRDAFRLVFNAGLSTAKVVTDVSGRGVGMDVVLSNITKMGGSIGIDSVKGQGSTFTITLPMTVTLAVIDGLVARIGEEQYIVPLAEVRESVRPSAAQLHTIKGEANEMLDVRGILYPLVRLNRLLGVHGESFDDAADATVVLVEGKNGGHGALMVDELLGQQSIVVKDLGKQFQNLRSIQGASILGDGRVGLVIDVNGILEMIGAQNAEG